MGDYWVRADSPSQQLKFQRSLTMLIAYTQLERGSAIWLTAEPRYQLDLGCEESVELRAAIQTALVIALHPPNTAQ